MKNKKIKIYQNKKIMYFNLILILFLIFFAVLTKFYLNKNSKINNIYKECESDEDCVLQQVTCCSCNMGGKEICMSKKNATYYQEKLKNCSDVMCIALYNCKKINCKCINGKCLEG